MRVVIINDGQNMQVVTAVIFASSKSKKGEKSFVFITSKEATND